MLALRLVGRRATRIERRATVSFGLGLLASAAACNAIVGNDTVTLWDPPAAAEAGAPGPRDGGADVALQPGVDSAVGADASAPDASLADSGSGADSACDHGGCIHCPPGSMACNGVCVDVTGDNGNCGACGNACLTSAGQSCVAAACGPAASLLIDYNGFALDDPAGGGAGTGLDQVVYIGASTNQEWVVSLVTMGRYKVLAANGLALTGSPTECAQVSLQSYTGANEQLWQLEANGAYTNIVNVASGKALDDDSGGGQGQNVLNCGFETGNDYQMWTLVNVSSVVPAVPDGTYAFLDGAGFALDDPGAATTASIDQEPYGGKDQQWTVTRVSGIQYEILSPSGLALAGAGAQCGQVALASYTGAPNQLWVFQSNGTDYNVLNAQSGWALDENNGGGQGVNVLSCDFSADNSSQIWSLNAALPAAAYAFTNVYGFALDDPPDGGAGAIPEQVVYAGVNQQWSLTNITGLQYEISSAGGYVLTSGTMSGTIAGVSTYTGASDQLWIFAPEQGGYSVVNMGTGLALDANGAGLGTQCNQWTVETGSNQIWNLTPASPLPPPIANGVYSFVNVAGLALDDGAPPDQVPYTGVDQDWTVTLVSNYEYEIASRSSGYALTSDPSNGPLPSASAYTGAANQLWSFAAIAGGSYFVINVGTGLLLDDNGSGTGTPNQWQWFGPPDQVWTLVAE